MLTVRRRRIGSAALKDCLFTFSVLDKRPVRQYLDKSEGPVKEKLSLAMRKHRYVCHRSLTTEDTGKHPVLESPFSGKVLLLLLLAVPPTIDSAQPRP